MLVDFESQVPGWVNRDLVRVVTLDEFIPPQYLPTFNSNTIEMFLGNIPGLSEYIIYGNDDFYAIKPLRPSQYFNTDGLPKISYSTKQKINTKFQGQCKRNWDVVVSHFPEAEIPGKFYEQTHDPQSITKTLIREASELLEVERLASITQKRDFDKNLSQYLYYDYAIATGQHEKRPGLHKFFELKRDKLPQILEHIKNRSTSWICLNDSKNTDKRVIPEITKTFQMLFPTPCKYEK